MVSLSGILAIGIGLFLMYLLLSFVTSYLTEFIADLLDLRAKTLANAVQNLFEPHAIKLEGPRKLKIAWEDGAGMWIEGSEADGGRLDRLDITKVNSNMVKVFYEHPVIQSLSRPNKLPSYIADHDFSTALLDIIIKVNPEPAYTPDEYLNAVKKNLYLFNEDLKRSILPLIEFAEVMEQDANKRILLARRNIENWFSTTMDRSTGWYKQKAQWIGILVGLFVAVFFNADTIGVSQSLWLKSTTPQAVSTNQILEYLSVLEFPIGWVTEKAERKAGTPANPREIPRTRGEIILKSIGLLITGLAISQGSSIWFDILNRVVNMRSAGVKPQSGGIFENNG
jgi:hypothetical protein